MRQAVMAAWRKKPVTDITTIIITITEQKTTAVKKQSIWQKTGENYGKYAKSHFHFVFLRFAKFVGLWYDKSTDAFI